MKLIRTRFGRKVVSLAAIAVITLAFTTVPAGRSAAAAAPSVQVIFSGVGFTDDGSLKVGFWLWCNPTGNSPIYTGACRGSVLVYGRGPALGVAGFIVENPDGTFVARVFSNKANSFLIAAVFHNADPEPAHGPNNLVEFGVLTANGAATGESTDAVVNVTGPGQ